MFSVLPMHRVPLSITMGLYDSDQVREQ